MSDEKKKNGNLLVGIDLGTSRSSISASNGERHVIESYVGWPADMVAQKVLKKKLLIGAEALENRPMLDLHRPLEEGLIKEGSSKDEQAVRELLRHLLQLVASGKEKNGSGVRAVVGVPAKTLRVNKQHLRSAMQGMVDAIMIVSEPFAVAYGMEALLHTMIIDIGAGTADFCIMHGRLPTDEDQRTLTNAGDWLDEQLSLAIREKYPDAKFSVHMVREWKEKWSFVGESKEQIKVNVPVAGKPAELNLTEPIRSTCEALVPPVVETVTDLLYRVEPEYQEKVRSNIILTGGTAQIRGLGARLQEELAEVGGGSVQVVEDPIFIGSDGSLAIAGDAPDADWEKLIAKVEG